MTFKVIWMVNHNTGQGHILRTGQGHGEGHIERKIFRSFQIRHKK